MSSPILSIVIATKNRQKYCKYAIKGILAIVDSRLQLIVRDNSDSDELKEFIKSCSNDKRLVYDYCNKAISSIDNFNAAMELATGEYVCMIGDDDTVLPNILEIAQWAKNEQIESVCQQSIVSYRWPINQEHNGILNIPSQRNEKNVIVIPRKKFEQLLNNGLITYEQYHLPRVYHGLIQRKILEQVIQQTGHFFGGLSPDIYSSVAFSYLVKKHVIINKYFTLAGACEKSTSIDSVKGRHSGKLEDAIHLKNRKNYNWNINVPQYYSIETIWADSAFHAMEEMGDFRGFSWFSYSYFLSYSFLTNASIRKLILASAKSTCKKTKRSFIITLIISLYCLQLICIRSLRKRLRLLGRRKRAVFIGIPDIDIAVQKILEFCDISN